MGILVDMIPGGRGGRDRLDEVVTGRALVVVFVPVSATFVYVFATRMARSWRVCARGWHVFGALVPRVAGERQRSTDIALVERDCNSSLITHNS